MVGMGRSRMVCSTNNAVDERELTLITGAGEEDLYD